MRWAGLLAAVMLAWTPRTESAAVLLPALSPFVALGAVLAARTVGVLALLALPVLVAVWLFPRWFCRYGCPTGLLQEMVERFHPNFAPPSRRVPDMGKWLVTLTVGGACLGYPMFLWLDPLALFNGFLSACRQPLTAASLLAGVGLPLLLLFTLILPRFWCQRLCPLGATQDLLAWPQRLLRLPARCESQAARALRGPALARRVFMGVSAGAAGVWMVNLTSGRTQPVLRPPGSIGEEHFTGVCVRCGNCAQACPSKIILPDFGTSGTAGLLTPRVRFDEDYCREDCHRCGQVCPSGAITRLSLAEKRRRAIGPAQVDQDICLLANGRECTACIKRCPYAAIAMQSTDGGFSSAPRVDLTRCTGCGACEALCPVRPRRAIRVIPWPGMLMRNQNVT
jgi:MauM/NapG family ferredoxin protein